VSTFKTFFGETIMNIVFPMQIEGELREIIFELIQLLSNPEFKKCSIEINDKGIFIIKDNNKIACFERLENGFKKLY